MPGANRPYTQLDADQVLKQSFDEEKDRLRVDAAITATIGDIRTDAEESDIAIKDRVTDNLLKINNDGSIDANVIVSASGGDNIAISDGVDTLSINNDGSVNVKILTTDLDIRDLNFSSDKVDVSGSSVQVSATDLDIRNLSSSQDNVSIKNGLNTLGVNTDGSVNVIAGSASIPADYTEATVAYPSPTVEVYTYKKGIITVKTVTVTYTSAAKTNIAGWVIS